MYYLRFDGSASTLARRCCRDCCGRPSSLRPMAGVSGSSTPRADVGPREAEASVASPPPSSASTSPSSAAEGSSDWRHACRVAVDWEPHGRRFLLTFHTARHCHQAQLSSTELHAAHASVRRLHSGLDQEFPSRLLAVRSCAEAQLVCADLQRYLCAVTAQCGPVLVAWVFFEAEEISYPEYETSVDDLQHRIVEEDLHQARNELTRLLEDKSAGAICLDSAYAMEDQVMTNISLALGEVFNFRMTTFNDLIELASSRGEDMVKWSEVAEAAQQAVDELTITYHAACLELVSGQRDRMMRDMCSVEVGRWTEAHHNRLLKLSAFVSQERLRWMIAIRTSKRREYDRLSASSRHKKHDRSLIEAKKEIYEHILKILQEEEGLLKKQKLIMEKITSGKARVSDFADAIEDVEELELIYGKRKLLSTGEAASRLSSIYQRRAILRNKVQTCHNILNKGTFRDSTVSFTGRLSGDSSCCVSLTVPSEETLEATRQDALKTLRDHYHKNCCSSELATTIHSTSPKSHVYPNSNNNNNNASESHINVKAASLS